MKVVLRRKFAAINACINKQARSQISNLTLQLMEAEEQQQTNPKPAEERK